ncbi:MAG: hypothetical protein ACREOI_28750 [bacterium]
MNFEDLFCKLVCLFLTLLLTSCRNSNEQKSDIRAGQQSEIEKTIGKASLAGQDDGEKLAIGIALKDGVPIYEDSSKTAVIDKTLNLADHILVLGRWRGNEKTFHFNGWTPVEDQLGKRGWVRYENLVLIEHFSCETSPQDSVFSNPNIDSTFKWALGRNSADLISRRIDNEGRIWIETYDNGGKYWLLRRKFVYNIKNTYYSILLEFVDFYQGEDEARGVNFKDLENPNKYGLVLKIADRLDFIRASGDTLPSQFDQEIGDSEYILGTTVLLPYAKSQAHREQGEASKSILELQKIIKDYPNQQLIYGRAGPKAAFELADIYLDHLQDTTQAIAQYHFIIHHYSEMEHGNCDELSWDAERSAMSILRLLRNDPAHLYLESEGIVTESRDPKIMLLGYAGKVRALGLQGRFKQMIDTALVAIAHYPNARYPDIPDSVRMTLNDLDPLTCLPVNYSNSVVSAAFAVLEEKGDLTTFPELADKIVARFGQYEIGAAAVLRKAQYADRTNGDQVKVVALYRRVLDGFADFYFVDRVKDDARAESIGKDMAQERIKELSYQSYSEVTIIKDAAELRTGFGQQFPVLKTLPLGTRAKFLYKDAELVRSDPYNPYNPQWAKIETKDGTIGWVSLSQIE